MHLIWLTQKVTEKQSFRTSKEKNYRNIVLLPAIEEERLNTYKFTNNSYSSRFLIQKSNEKQRPKPLTRNTLNRMHFPAPVLLKAFPGCLRPCLLRGFPVGSLPSS